jgi:hypothetical protein
MRKNYIKTAIVLIMAILLPVTATADMSKDTQESIENVCKAAIAKKGYKNYTYKYTEIMEVHYGGGYSMTGQLHQDGKRFGYNCLVDKQLSLTFLGIDDIDKL